MLGTPISDGVRDIAQLLSGGRDQYDLLLDLIGDARFVLIGEASHGTHEFYRERAEITKRLIAERGFAAVAVEADWPHAQRVNHYVRGRSDDPDGRGALVGFKRFPTWMWRNTDVLEFIEWLHLHNAMRVRDEERVGFYGLDLYGLHDSIAEVLRYLAKVDPEAAKRARRHYACFDHFGADTQAYGYAAAFGMTRSCEQDVVNALVQLRARAAEYAARDGRAAADDAFYAEQNARLVKNAEEYYRTMFLGRVSSWNLRDTHMSETLNALANHLSRDRPAKIVVWAHNSHLGDARATAMGDAGELNLGQLTRARYGELAVLVGLTTHTGTVTAASDWDAPAERKRVRPSLAGSYERVFHDTGLPRFWLPLRTDLRARALVADARLERAVGVIYRPETERASHYFEARLAEQFDALLHFDVTQALEPLERNVEWQTGDVPETFPTGV